MKPVEINHFSDTTLMIVWDDGHESLYLFEDLRRACPCEACYVQSKSKSFKKVIPLGVGQGNLYPEEIKWVGNYALYFAWSDGHKTGIYTFEFLRKLCICEECQSQKVTGEER